MERSLLCALPLLALLGCQPAVSSAPEATQAVSPQTPPAATTSVTSGSITIHPFVRGLPSQAQILFDTTIVGFAINGEMKIAGIALGKHEILAIKYIRADSYHCERWSASETIELSSSNATMDVNLTLVYEGLYVMGLNAIIDPP